MKRFSFLKKEGGFTLIELLVVMLIIGILLLIAVPSLLGNVNKAKVTQQKSQLNTVYLALKSGATTLPQDGNFTGLDPYAAVSDSEGSTVAGGYVYYSIYPTDGAGKFDAAQYKTDMAEVTAGTFTLNVPATPPATGFTLNPDLSKSLDHDYSTKTNANGTLITPDDPGLSETFVVTAAGDPGTLGTSTGPGTPATLPNVASGGVQCIGIFNSTMAPVYGPADSDHTCP